MSMNVKDAGVAFYGATNKHNEINSDNENVQGNKKKFDKYSYLSIEKISEKSNMKHLI